MKAMLYQLGDWMRLRWNRRRLGLLLCATCVVIIPVLAQFEGIVESKNVTTDELGRAQEFTMTMWVKKDMVRIEMKGAAILGSTMLYRTDMKRIYMLNHEEKSYFEISQDEKAQEMFVAGGTQAKYSIKRTGKKKSIAGYPCEEFLIRRDAEETRLWGTKKLAHLVSAISKALGQDHAGTGEGASYEVMKMGIYPMSSATRLEGKTIESQEVTKIETKSLETNLFTLPTDYKKQKTLDMMQGVEEKK